MKGPYDYMLLPTGSEYSTIVPFTCLDLTGSASWMVTVRYRDTRHQPPPAPKWAKWFTAEVVSNSAEIAVRNAGRGEVR